MILIRSFPGTFLVGPLPGGVPTLTFKNIKSIFDFLKNKMKKSKKMMIDTPPGVVPIAKDPGNERIRIRQKSLKIWAHNSFKQAF